MLGACAYAVGSKRDDVIANALAAWILSEVVSSDFGQVDLGEPQRCSGCRRLSHVVDLIDEHTEPLISRTMGVEPSDSEQGSSGR